jgi:hypothetical protein
MQRIRLLLGGNSILVLSIYWALTQLVIVWHKGVMISVDTSLYVHSAKELLLHFRIEEAHDFWYISYTLVLALTSVFTNSLEAVVFFQILLSGLALLALYKAVLTISGRKSVAFMSGFLYVFWFEIHTWNVFIYTESLFVSCCIISFYLLVQSKTFWRYSVTITFILFTCLIRPAGFSLLVASMCYFFVKLELPRKAKIFIGIAATCLIFMLLNEMLKSYELISSYAKAARLKSFTPTSAF